MIKNIIVILMLVVLCGATPVFATAADPFHLGVGARPLSMGKAFVAIADDANGIFVNPAGLGSLTSSQLISMYSNVTDDTSYVLLGGTHNTDYGTLGMGLLSVGVGEIYTTSRDDYGRVVLNSTFSYSNQVFLLSWGKEFLPELLVGATTKLYQENMDGISGGRASGMGLDVGVLYKPFTNWQFGFLGRNFIATPVVWDTGHLGQMTRLGKLGAAFLPNQDITVGLDLDLQDNNPLLWHLGGEWRPAKFIAFRLGMDQAAIDPSTAITNFSTGLGIRYADFEFDYAYCHDTDLTYNSQHYFSLAFGVLRDEEEKVVPPIEVTPTATPEVIEIEVIEIEEVVQLTIIEHTIKRGETLSTIANKYYGNPALYKEIAKFNNIKNPNNIKVGTILKIDLSLKDKLKKR